jgi:ABC-2 type transport system ATP-binding protein
LLNAECCFLSAVLQFESVTKEYRSGWNRRILCALDQFSLEVKQGEIFGFLGPNGAGKSTAIHLAMGFMRPTRGSGVILGHPFGYARTRRRVGFLAENVALYHMPARRLVRFYGALNGLRDPVLARRVREVLELLDLTADANRNTGKYSRGMLQRVGLAQALVNDPELLLLDEPTSALDPLGRVTVRELLISARNAGKTVFLSSHLLSEVELVCDRIAILHRGRLVRLAHTADLLESRTQSEIVARGIDAGQFPGAACADGLVRFTVRTAALRPEIERVWTLGGEVVSVNPVRRSLEEIFVELTAGAGTVET